MVRTWPSISPCGALAGDQSAPRPNRLWLQRGDVRGLIHNVLIRELHHDRLHRNRVLSITRPALEIVELAGSRYEQEEEKLKIVPGSIEVVRWTAQHYKLALATSATTRNRVAALDLLGIAGSFEVIADLSHVSEPKPSPEIYLTAVSRLALAPSQMHGRGRRIDWCSLRETCGLCGLSLNPNLRVRSVTRVGADFTFESFAKLQCFLKNEAWPLMRNEGLSRYT